MILQKDALTDKVTRSENVFDGGGARCRVTGGSCRRRGIGTDGREGEGSGGGERAGKREWTGGGGR